MILNTPERFMQKALQEAGNAYDEDEVPVGAIIVIEDNIIAKAHNQVEQLKDPTAHAEMIAITQATSFLKQKWLMGCTMYVTIEPCSMCAGALVLARIDRVVFGASDPKTGAFGSKFDISSLQLNHSLIVERGLLDHECGLLMKEFFERKRNKKTSVSLPYRDSTNNEDS